MGTILVENLEVIGVHGVLPEERERAQPFRIDLELEVDLGRAGVTDDLTDTVHYGEVSEAVAAIVGGESYQLLERLATRVGEECLRDPRVVSAVVTIRKLRPPIPLSMDSVGVRIEANRA
ncbi:MAG: dihydroneopterin aldolase [Acidimicrobiia bacterium]